MVNMKCDTVCGGIDLFEGWHLQAIRGVGWKGGGDHTHLYKKKMFV